MTKKEKWEIWRKRVEDCPASGLTIPAYCAQEGISVPSFYYWRKRVADGEVSPAEKTHGAGFLPVTLTPVRLPAPAIEVRLLSGRSLKLSAPVDGQWLHTLIQPSLRCHPPTRSSASVVP
ncbi:IS66 family insertion sequence element accessory protein TnpB [Acidithiobacillus sp.]|uniref:IS66 family insertion sequence element accessory protein TnpA n=1 Tax=Acidithiobacillus sp. TaxID=1872118 RepID=UPI0032B01860